MKNIRSSLFILLGFISVISLSACSGIETEAKYPKSRGGEVVYTGEEESIFGEGGLDLFNTSKKKEEGSNSATLGVNTFLWRASLETLSFMPIASADPFGGVIITDWHAPNGSAEERFKVNVFITDRELKADGIRVSAFKQMKQNDGWSDETVSKETQTKLEDAILAKAREIRIREEG